MVDPKKKRRDREKMARRQAGFSLQQLYDQSCHSMNEGSLEEGQVYWVWIRRKYEFSF